MLSSGININVNYGQVAIRKITKQVGMHAASQFGQPAWCSLGGSAKDKPFIIWDVLPTLRMG